MPSARVTFNGAVLAESDRTVIVEGNHYFPPDSINREHFHENTRHTVCPWKGEADYFDIKVGGEESGSAAWVYRSPSQAAEPIRDHVAFYSHKVEIQGL